MKDDILAVIPRFARLVSLVCVRYGPFLYLIRVGIYQLLSLIMGFQ